MTWMAWTIPTASFFAAIILALIGMTIWELRSPTTQRRGFLIRSTTRGDRFFICLLGSAIFHILWIAATDIDILWATTLCVFLSVLVMRYG